MMQLSKSKSIKLLSLIFVFSLLLFGCGSSGGGGGNNNPVPSTDADSDTDTSTETATATEADTSTDTDTAVETEVDFTGNYTLYNEFVECLWTFYNFDVSIVQTGNRAELTALGQSLECQVIGTELSCEGTLTVEDLSDSGTLRFEFQAFMLQQQDGGLFGESQYSAANDSGEGCEGTVHTTSVAPDVGSFFVENDSSLTFEGWFASPCGLNQWAYLPFSNPPFAPGDIDYFTPSPGCYDVRFCQTIETDGENHNGVGCTVGKNNIQIEAAATFGLWLTDPGS